MFLEVNLEPSNKRVATDYILLKINVIAEDPERLKAPLQRIEGVDPGYVVFAPGQNSFAVKFLGTQTLSSLEMQLREHTKVEHIVFKVGCNIIHNDDFNNTIHSIINLVLENESKSKPKPRPRL